MESFVDDSEYFFQGWHSIHEQKRNRRKEQKKKEEEEQKKKAGTSHTVSASLSPQ